MIEVDTLPKGWIIAKLGDLCEIVMGQSPPSDTYNLSGVGLPFFQGKKEFTELHPIVEKWCSQPNKIAENDDILISVRAPVGDTNIADQKCCIGRGLAAIRYSGNNRYVLYFLKLIKQQLNEKGTGTTFKAISGEILRNTKIPLAPLNEQKRILAKLEQLLTDLDKGIEYLETTKQQLKVYRQAVLKWAFEGKLTNEKNIRWGFLKEIVEGVEYGSAAKSKKQGKVPVLRMGNIQNGRFEWDDLVYTDNDEEIKKYLLKKDDVLFNRTNSPEWVGKTAIYKGEQPAIFAGYLIRINSKENSLDPNYLNYFLNSQIAKNHGNKVKSFGVNQSNINGTKLKQYPFPICGLDSQKAIVKEIESRLSVCDKIEETIESSLQQAEALRLSIIKKAFEGKLVPQDPNDEPAEKLLERIKDAKFSIGKKKFK